MMVFIWLTTESTIVAVSVCNFWGASFRRIARVVDRHVFMLSTGPEEGQLCSSNNTSI